MSRWLYVALVRLHPRHFREHFGEEMIGIYDEEARNGIPIRLFFDAVISLFRQWGLRPVRREPAFSFVGPAQSSGIPVFHTFESQLPRRSAMINGAVLSLIFFGAVTLAIGRGGGSMPRLFIGAKYPRPHVLPVDRASVMEAEPTTEIKVKAPAVDPLYQLANAYFQIIRVLEVLDGDRDRIISSREIGAASSLLTRLDRDGDGRLSAEECGFFLGNNPNLKFDSDFTARARLEFMRSNPVLAALDADSNGEISAEEIKNSSVMLTLLDKNRDGLLTPAEALPELVDNRTAMILSKLDTNRDRQISESERATAEPGPLRELFDSADRNGDGVITAGELTAQFRLRDQLESKK